MEGIHNFRDVGGQRTEDDRLVKRGMLYRSGSLADASDADMERLSALGIRTICDLRTHQERDDNPSRIPRHAGIRALHVPVKVNQHDESGLLLRVLWLLFGKARRLDYGKLARESYREYVTDFRPQFSTVMKLTADDHNLPLLIHCTAGKDRTGFACSLIQLTLGVPPEAVVEDYLRSNEHLDAFTDRMLHKLRFASLFGLSREKLLPLFEARREYLEAAFDQIRDDYGTVSDYVREGLGISSKEVRRLKGLLLEDG